MGFAVATGFADAGLAATPLLAAAGDLGAGVFAGASSPAAFFARLRARISATLGRLPVGAWVTGPAAAAFLLGASDWLSETSTLVLASSGRVTESIGAPERGAASEEISEAGG